MSCSSSSASALLTGRLNWSKRRSPFCFSAPWHSVQYVSRNDRRVASSAVRAVGDGSAAAVPNVTKTAASATAATRAKRVLMRVLLSGDLQPRQRAGAEAEPVGLDPEALQQAEVEIAELRAAP